MTAQLTIPGLTPPTENSRQEAGTPQHIFDALHSEYRFTLDVCAVAHNAKLPNFWTPTDDALTRHWGRERRVWCNPPYEDIGPWLAHAWEPRHFAAYLLPVRTGRLWWREWARVGERHYFVGETPHERIAFDAPPGVTYKHGPAFDCCLFLIGSGAEERIEAGREVWRSGRTGERL